MRCNLYQKKQALFAAIEKRDVKAVRDELSEREFFLFRTVSPNILNEEGFSPLHKAVLARNNAIIALLVRAGAIIDTNLDCRHVRSTGYHDSQPGVRFGRGRTDYHHALDDGSDDYKSNCFSHVRYVLQQEQLHYYLRALETKISNDDLESLETLIAAGARKYRSNSLIAASS